MYVDEYEESRVHDTAVPPRRSTTDAVEHLLHSDDARFEENLYLCPNTPLL
jgi:hypothetical protein